MLNGFEIYPICQTFYRLTMRYGASWVQSRSGKEFVKISNWETDIMFENFETWKRAAPVLDIHFPNLGRGRARLCDRRTRVTV